MGDRRLVLFALEFDQTFVEVQLKHTAFGLLPARQKAVELLGVFGSPSRFNPRHSARPIVQALDPPMPR